MRRVLSTEYVNHLKSDYWKGLRAQVWRRAFGYCEYSGNGVIGRCMNKAQHLHHETYVRLGCEREEDVIAVCRFHHELLHRAHAKSGRSLTAIYDAWLRRSA